MNIVALANLNNVLDLYGLASVIPNMEYEPEQFPGAILKVHDPKLTLLLFKNGKLIIAGAKSEYLLKKGLKKAVKIIKETNAHSKTKKSTTKNKLITKTLKKIK